MNWINFFTPLIKLKYELLDASQTIHYFTDVNKTSRKLYHPHSSCLRLLPRLYFEIALTNWAITYGLISCSKVLIPPQKKLIMFTFRLDCAQWPSGLCHRTNKTPLPRYDFRESLCPMQIKTAGFPGISPWVKFGHEMFKTHKEKCY